RRAVLCLYDTRPDPGRQHPLLPRSALGGYRVTPWQDLGMVGAQDVRHHGDFFTERLRRRTSARGPGANRCTHGHLPPARPVGLRYLRYDDKLQGLYGTFPPASRSSRRRHKPVVPRCAATIADRAAVQVDCCPALAAKCIASGAASWLTVRRRRCERGELYTLLEP